MALKTVLFDIGGTLVKYPLLSKAVKQFREHAEIIGVDQAVLEDLATFRTRPNQTIYVGDKFDRDVKGANSVNMPVSWINSSTAKEDVRFKGWRVDNLKQVLEIVRSL